MNTFTKYVLFLKGLSTVGIQLQAAIADGTGKKCPMCPFRTLFH